MNPKISVILIVKNEEKNIHACLESVKWADEIVVIDDESTDHTVEIAKQYTDKVIHRKMDTEGKQRNFANAQASHDWVLMLDADERVTHELADEIRQVLSSCQAEITHFSIPIKNYIGDHWIQGAGYYPARKMRLFKKGYVFYNEMQKVHPTVKIDGKNQNLNQDIIHYNHRNMSTLLNKLNRETTLEVEKWLQEGRKVTVLKILRKMLSRFYKFYIQKKGYKYGFSGFFFSCLHALYQFISYAKYWEAKNIGPRKELFIPSSSPTIDPKSAENASNESVTAHSDSV